MKEDKIWTIGDILHWGVDYFLSKNIDSPRLNIELLLTNVLNIKRIALYTQYDKPLNEDELAALKQKIKRRVAREPLQYILGYTDFMGLELKVDSNCLIPRPETELMTEFILKTISPLQIKTVLDIGTGSGCIALCLAKALPNAAVTGIDVSEAAISVAKENQKNNLLRNVTFRAVDVFNDCNFGERYDLIVSNPPYISKDEYGKLEQELYYEPQIALTDSGDGLKFYKIFSEIFPVILSENGSFFLEIGYDQENAVKEIFKMKGYNIEFMKDFSDISRIAYYVKSL